MANPVAATAALRKDVNGSTPTWVYKNMTAQGTSLLKTGPGTLHSVTFNKPVATSTLELDDALTHTSPIIGTVTVPASPMPVTLIYDVEYATGLSVTMGTADMDVTIAYS